MAQSDISKRIEQNDEYSQWCAEQKDAQDKWLKTQETHAKNRNFHFILTKADSVFLPTQVSGDTVSTTSVAFFAVAKKTASVAGQFVLGLGDPFMMISIGIRATLGFIRAAFAPLVDARKTRLTTSFLTIGCALVALLLLFKVIIAAPIFVPLCLLGAAGLGFYNHMYILWQKIATTPKTEPTQTSSSLKKDLDFLLEESFKTHDDKAEKERIEKMISLTEDAIVREEYDHHAAQHKYIFDHQTIGFMKVLAGARTVALLGLVFILTSFAFPPVGAILLTVGIGLFVVSGLINGFTRVKEIKAEESFHQNVGSDKLNEIRKDVHLEIVEETGNKYDLQQKEAHENKTQALTKSIFTQHKEIIEEMTKKFRDTKSDFDKENKTLLGKVSMYHPHPSATDDEGEGESEQPHHANCHHK